MISFPNAKVNLGLNIVGVRPNGYHDLETVFYPIELCDVLEIVPSRSGKTTLECYGRKVDCPMENNLVYKAFELMRKEFDVPAVEMYLYKHIPDGAGLGGGSSDASSALKMLNAIFSLGLSDGDLAKRAAAIGADCPFFIYNKPLKATGIGDVFAPVELSLEGKTMLLVKPDVSVSTKLAYSKVVPAPADCALESLLAKPMTEWNGTVKNDFEQSVFVEFPELAAIKAGLIEAGAEYAAMSGSGSAIFGIFDNAKMAEKAAEKVEKYNHFVIALH